MPLRFVKPRTSQKLYGISSLIGTLWATEMFTYSKWISFVYIRKWMLGSHYGEHQGTSQKFYKGKLGLYKEYPNSISSAGDVSYKQVNKRLAWQELTIAVSTIYVYDQGWNKDVLTCTTLWKPYYAKLNFVLLSSLQPVDWLAIKIPRFELSRNDTQIYM